MPQKQDEKLYEALDYICTSLAEGALWHIKSANECRKISIRGWARWHDQEALGDNKTLCELSKILQDKLDFTPNIDAKEIDKINDYKLSGIEDFKQHHLDWIKNEEAFVNAINFAITKTAAIDMQIYKKLCKMVDEVQGEIMRVRMAYDNLEFGQWMPHDISVKSKWVHDYFDRDHKHGGDINFNIG